MRLCNQEEHPQPTRRAIQALIYGFALNHKKIVLLLGYHVGPKGGQIDPRINPRRSRQVCPQQQSSQRCHSFYSRRQYAKTREPSHFLRKSRRITKKSSLGVVCADV